jgi:valyl-tRNA synthetase
MKEISVRAKDAVENDEVKLHPAKFKNTYRHWMENVRDWCISRQLWWGHRIPAWYDEKGNYVVAENEEEAYSIYNFRFKIQDSKLTQDSDVLDTWASSWLWPMEVFNGFGDGSFDKEKGKIIKGTNPDLDYFYPTQVLVTAPEILFFWVARMIIAGYEYMGEKPFEDVYLTGIVRDKLGRKMSKSLGNSPDPLELIKQYGADGVRTGMLFSSPAGNDLLFDEGLCEQGRNFSNKIWNAFRLVKGWSSEPIHQPEENKIAVAWFESKMNLALAELEDHFSKFRLSDALMTVYKLVWDDFCAWYLEIIKPEYKADRESQAIDANTLTATIGFFETLLKMLHPFMPFITEELWHELKERESKNFLIVAAWPNVGTVSNALISESELAFQIITELRKTRNVKGISPKEPLRLAIKNMEQAPIQSFLLIVKKLSNVSEIFSVKEQVANATGLLVKNMELFIPLSGIVDVEKEREEILKEIKYFQGFIEKIEKKLSNEKFVNSAPPSVVETERKKLSDAVSKIKSLEENLKQIGER